MKADVRDALVARGHDMSPVDKPRNTVRRGTTEMIAIDQKKGRSWWRCATGPRQYWVPTRYSCPSRPAATVRINIRDRSEPVADLPKTRRP